jgi:hypothetical protein
MLQTSKKISKFLYEIRRNNLISNGNGCGGVLPEIQ